ncbi:MFS transporter [Brachymonas denitrificans]|jgi:MFS family permease|uniref:Major Facilitator Superfamily protein n=1 Tax=Brachymonas denitrificans DSM 15123 TaxID=1121117 RepID=A0A1H8E4W9_9BURK|nr:MFS transporter [Brachymonas denitrificans]SEN14619.1 Major Facilitator Superfamily protein [Brachymonas denitrificans DSM 15123]
MQELSTDAPSKSGARPPTRFTYLLLLALYLAQGLPVGFVTQALPVILREQQASLVLIGWSGVLLMPWGLKFLWAPLQDRYYWPRIGLGRSWILPTQGVALLCVAGLALLEPSLLRDPQMAVLFASLLMLLAFAGATQDVSTDGLAVRLLAAGERSMGNAIQVTGSRMGLILGGGGALLLLDMAPWRTVMLGMAGLILLTTVPVWLLREPAWRRARKNQDVAGAGTVRHDAELKRALLPAGEMVEQTALPAELQQADEVACAAPVQGLLPRIRHFLRTEFGYFLSSPELRAWLGVLLVYKLCDAFTSGMVKPMLVDMGYSKSQIGTMVVMLGSGASLLGAVAGHAVLRRVSRMRALLGFNALQALTTGCYALIALLFSGKVSAADGLTAFDMLVYGINALEHFTAGMALVGVLTTVMDYCRHRNGGSDFTLQVSIMSTVSGVAHWLSGYAAEALGYLGYFSAGMVLGLLLLGPLVRWGRLQRQTHPA